MLRMNWVRRPKSSLNYFPRAEFGGNLHAVHVRPDGGWIELGFSTEGGSRFSSSIGPNEFEILAQEMMKADPEAALKAFGKAMQDVSIPKPERKLARRTAA